VTVDGHRVAVKVSRLGDRVVHVSVEFEDVLRVAGATGQPAKRVLARAQEAADERYGTPGEDRLDLHEEGE
jgi:hypothetical protein